VKVGVIGAGAVGSAAARFLSLAGHEVIVFEQFGRGHSLGSSHGTSRIIRRAYQDPFYADLMEEVFPLWRELEAEAGEELYIETGVLVFGKPNSEYLHSTREALHSLHVPYDVLGHINVARQCGGFHIDPDEEAIYQPEAGLLRADRCIEACLASATAYGAQLQFDTRATIDDNGSINGERFDAIVVCAGSWTSKISGARDLAARLQRFAYFDAPMEPDIPVWIEASPDHFYGFPNYGRGFKVGLHKYGPEFDPDDNRPKNDDALQAIASEARRRLGADVMLEAHDCVYTVAPNEDFRIGKLSLPIPAYWASPCSGHGFKFAIWFGKLMADLVDGKQHLENFPRFVA
jgi:sarcosine oxidase